MAPLIVFPSLSMALAMPPASRVPSTHAKPAAALSTAKHPQQTLSIFYTESDYDSASRKWVGRVQKLEAINPDEPRSIYDGVCPTGLAVDSCHGRLYVTDPRAPAIVSCEFDGSNVQSIGAGLFGTRMMDGPWGITIAPTMNTVMWSAAGHCAIRRADLDGSNVQIASQGDSSAWSASGPFGLGVCLRPGCAMAMRSARSPTDSFMQNGLGRIYWTSWGRIQVCEMGTGQVSDVVRGLIDPTALVVDTEHRRLFWTDAKAGKVQCSALDGSRVCDVATGLSSPWGLALGPTHLFWTDRGRGVVQSCCLSTGIVRDVLSGLREPKGVALLNGPSVRGRVVAEGTDTQGASKTQTAPSIVAASQAPGGHGLMRLRPTVASRARRAQRRAPRVDTLKGREKVDGLRGQQAVGQGVGIASGQGPSKPPNVQDIMYRSAHALQRLQANDVLPMQP
uniref:SMP-30/Gluconolactonase/LRE-like region domain-containing protein n=1 Tax=Coccolithus braarudii TaxID=221442 RepID=A0A7S0QA41_9EUKA|mmetsp:Transcript_5325/g.11714  ORF Transcript_5325/g.11714 Transcript_5325/m.11714 type:complete len:450 (+) Transcript_5325:78-1427(+)